MCLPLDKGFENRQIYRLIRLIFKVFMSCVLFSCCVKCLIIILFFKVKPFTYCIILINLFSWEALVLTMFISPVTSIPRLLLVFLRHQGSPHIKSKFKHFIVLCNCQQFWKIYTHHFFTISSIIFFKLKNRVVTLINDKSACAIRIASSLF